MHTTKHHLGLALGLLLASVAPAAAAVRMTTDPPQPAADVPFRLLITGTSFLYPQPRDPEPEVTVDLDADSIVLRFGAVVQAIGVPAPIPFAFWVEFPDGLPSHDGYGRQYTLRVETFLVDMPDQAIEEVELSFFVGVGADVATPGRVTETDPVRLVVSGSASCPRLGEVEVVAGSEIWIGMGLECFVLPPDPSPYHFEIDVGTLAAGLYRVIVVSEEATLAAATLEVLPDPVRIRGSRFQVDVTFGVHEDSARRASLVQAPSEESALFWFFGPDNWELMVKVLDGCDLNDHFWVFGAATTDVAYEITIEDTATGSFWTASNPPGHVAEAITDTAAFPCEKASTGRVQR